MKAPGYPTYPTTILGSWKVLGSIALLAPNTASNSASRPFSDGLEAELEAEGILERRIFAEVPVRVEYRLTPRGAALIPIYESIGGWAARWIDGIEDPSACRLHGEESVTTASTRR